MKYKKILVIYIRLLLGFLWVKLLVYNFSLCKIQNVVFLYKYKNIKGFYNLNQLRFICNFEFDFSVCILKQFEELNFL